MRTVEIDWGPSDQSSQFLPDEIHLWWVPFACAKQNQAALFSRLSLSERQRAEKNERFGYFRGFLRKILEEAYAIRGEEILSTPEGKPFLVGQSLQFNLSHCAEHLVLAFSADRGVGVDLENMSPRPKYLDLAKRFFSEREQLQLSSISEQAQLEVFYRLWTQKEAILKARSKTIGSAGLGSLEVSEYAASTVSFSPAEHTQAALSVASGGLTERNLRGFRIDV